MSVVIVGGNERMIRQYKDLCREYHCDAKVFIKMNDGLKNKMGKPDLLVLFTSTVSHKMAKFALNEAKGTDTLTLRVRSSSLSALKDILNSHAPRA